jgi:hypothetical protein
VPLNIYVFPAEGGWAIRRGRTSQDIVATHPQKRVAVKVARQLARTLDVDVVVLEDSAAAAVIFGEAKAVRKENADDGGQ